MAERQKATRQLKKLQKRKNKGSEDDEDLDDQALAEAIHEAEVDLNYTMYSPLDWPYVSLWPKEKGKQSRGDNTDEEGEDQQKDAATMNGLDDSKIRGDPEMRSLVEQCMREGKLDDLRNGRMTKDRNSAKEIRLPSRPKKARPAKEAQPRAERVGKKAGKKQQVGEDAMDEDSDGGFFE